MRFNVFMAMKVWIATLWIVTPCGLVGGYHNPDEACRYATLHRRALCVVTCAGSERNIYP